MKAEKQHGEWSLRKTSMNENHCKCQITFSLRAHSFQQYKLKECE